MVAHSDGTSPAVQKSKNSLHSSPASVHPQLTQTPPEQNFRLLDKDDEGNENSHFDNTITDGINEGDEFVDTQSSPSIRTSAQDLMEATELIRRLNSALTAGRESEKERSRYVLRLEERIDRMSAVKKEVTAENMLLRAEVTEIRLTKKALEQTIKEKETELLHVNSSYKGLVTKVDKWKDQLKVKEIENAALTREILALRVESQSEKGMIKRKEEQLRRQWTVEQSKKEKSLLTAQEKEKRTLLGGHAPSNQLLEEMNRAKATLLSVEVEEAVKVETERLENELLEVRIQCGNEISRVQEEAALSLSTAAEKATLLQERMDLLKSELEVKESTILALKDQANEAAGQWQEELQSVEFAGRERETALQDSLENLKKENKVIEKALLRDIEGLKEKLEEADVIQEALHVDLQDTQQQLSTSQERVASLEASIHDLQSQLVDSNATNDNTQEEIKTLQKLLSAAEQQKQERLRESAILQTDMALLMENGNASQSEAKALRDQLRQAQVLEQTLRASIDELEREQKVLRLQVAANTTVRQEFESALQEALSREQERLTAIQERHQAEKQKNVTALASMRRQHRQLEEQLLAVSSVSPASNELDDALKRLRHISMEGATDSADNAEVVDQDAFKSVRQIIAKLEGDTTVKGPDPVVDDHLREVDPTVAAVPLPDLPEENGEVKEVKEVKDMPSDAVPTGDAAAVEEEEAPVSLNVSDKTNTPPLLPVSLVSTLPDDGQIDDDQPIETDGNLEEYINNLQGKLDSAIERAVHLEDTSDGVVSEEEEEEEEDYKAYL
jgi:hypothetical protein